jgi:hypothetical protein
MDSPVSLHTNRWKALAFWIAPWVLYLVLAAVTVAAAKLSDHGFWWLHLLVKKDVLVSLAVVIVLFWLIVRFLLAVKSTNRILVSLAMLAELPVAFVVYVVWVFSMIGGPTNPG